MSVEDFIILVYCWVEENLREVLKGQVLRSRGFGPKLSDAEVVTMEIVGEFLGYDSDKGVWSYFCQHWKPWFPHLGSRAQFAKQCAHLWAVKQALGKRLAQTLGATEDSVHIVDGFPIPVAKIKRAPRSKVFKGIAEYGYCASKDEYYYGFKGHLLINSVGVITGITLTAAAQSEREAVWDMVSDIQGVLLGDKGYLGEWFKTELQAQGIHLETPVRNNMQDSLLPEQRNRLNNKRRLVETVIGQLTDRLSIEVTRARDLWHLTNRITRKVMAHSIGILANLTLGNHPLRFEQILAN